MQPLQIIAISSLGIAAMLSLLAFLKRNRLMVYLSIFLCVSFLFELTNTLLALRGVRNIGVYNFFNAASFLFLAWFFSGIITSKLYRVVIKWFMLVFILFFTSIYFFIQAKQNFFTYSYITGALMIVVSCIVYFRQIFRTENFHPISIDPFFWFCFAWFLFYVSVVPLMGMFNFLQSSFPEKFFFYYGYIIFSLNIIMNSLISTGFVCDRIFRKRFF